MSNICNSRWFAFKNITYSVELIAVAADKIPKWFPLVMILLQIQGLRFYGKIKGSGDELWIQQDQKGFCCLVLIFWNNTNYTIKMWGGKYDFTSCIWKNWEEVQRNCANKFPILTDFLKSSFSGEWNLNLLVRSIDAFFFLNEINFALLQIVLIHFQRRKQN